MKTEITTDGKVVWVNTDRCIGRFCRVSGEIMFSNGDVLTIKPDWQLWTEKMKRYHKIRIAKKHKPNYEEVN